MSDGPYKSLPMKQSWRDVCERAHKEAFTEQERAQSMCVALHKDFLREVGKDYLMAIGNVLVDQQQGNLLSDHTNFEIDAIRYKFTQSPLRDALSEHIHAALYDGFSGERAIVEAVQRTTIDHGHSHIRQIEEHYKRDARDHNEQQKVISVRENLTRTLETDQVGKFGQDIVRLIRGEAVVSRLVKASGLDDGPELR